MKKRIIITFLCMVMAIACCVPCFAAKVDFSALEQVDIDRTEYPYCTIIKGLVGSFAHFSKELPSYKSGNSYDDLMITHNGSITFMYNPDTGEFSRTGENSGMTISSILYHDYDILDGNGNVLFKAMYPPRPIAFEDFKNPIEAFFEQITVENVVSVLAWIATAVVAFPFLWWGVRKLTRAVMGAFKKGRVNL